MTKAAGEATISHLGGRGDGVARIAGAPVYVPFAAPGDRIALENGRARIVAQGERRQPPACAHFGTCGGCQVQHLDIETYRNWKRDLVRLPLERAGIAVPELAATAESPPASRRRARFAARRLARGSVLGFNVARSHRIVPLSECPVLDPAIERLLPALAALVEALCPAGTALDLQATASEAGIDLVLHGLAEPDGAARALLGEWAHTQDLARLAFAGHDRGPPEILLTRRQPVLRWDEVALVPPPAGFLQATPAGEAALQAFVTRHLGAARRIVDLFAGCGTLSVPARRQAQVHAVDSDGAALAALDTATRAAGRGRPPSLERRDLFRRPLQPAELAAFDTAIFDPPRAGARDQATALAASGIGRVIAVSCNPSSFARDAALLVDGGFRLESVQPVDQFLWSAHMELAALFSR